MRWTRRSFLAAVSAPAVLPGTVWGNSSVEKPLRVAVVGLGAQGQKRLKEALSLPDARVAVVCDCDRRKLETAKRLGIPWTERYEEILADDSIDVILNATCDHWHAKITVDACRAGKDVFCESPLASTPAECVAMTQAARENHRIVACGDILNAVVSGNAASVATGSLPVAFRTPAMPIPEGLDWERWQGSVKHVPYNAWRLENWRWFRDYGNGPMAQGGADRFSAVLRAVGLENELPVKLFPPGCVENPGRGVCAVFANGFRLYHNDGGNTDFSPVSSTLATFFESVRERREPVNSFQTAAISAILCQRIALCCEKNGEV